MKIKVSKQNTLDVTEYMPFHPQEHVSSRFEIEELIGFGPSGYVYRAKDTHPQSSEKDRQVALKFFHARLVKTTQDKERLHKGIAFAQKLNHANLIKPIYSAEDKELCYISMPHVRGLSLEKAIHMRLKQIPFKLHEAEQIISPVCQALHKMHHLGAHGDLKPSNILIQPGEIKITDAMLTRGLLLKPFFAGFKTQLNYVAPELRSGDLSTLDARADVFSLAAILFEMLTLNHPKNILKIQEDLLLNRLHRHLQSFFLTALHIHKDSRFASIQEFYHHFLELVDNSHVYESQLIGDNESTIANFYIPKASDIEEEQTNHPNLKHPETVHIQVQETKKANFNLTYLLLLIIIFVIISALFTIHYKGLPGFGLSKAPASSQPAH